MKQTIVISLYDGVNSAILVPTYFDNEKNRTLILDNRFHVHVDKLSVGAVRYSATLDRKNRPNVFLNWDWSDTAKNQVEIPFQKLAKEMLMGHPNIFVEGHHNKNLKEPLFKMTILEDVENSESMLFDLRLTVMNIIANLTHEKRQDVAFYFGINPIGMSTKKLLLTLVGRDGFLMLEKNAKDFIHFMSNLDNKEIIISAVVKKAIALGKLNVRSGKYYSFGDEQLIGVTEDDVVKYYFANEKMFDFLLKEVGISDFSKEKIAAPKEVKSEAKSELSEKDVRAKASALGIPNFHNGNIEKLKEAIAIKENELA